MALAFGLSVRSELSKSTASAIRQAIFVIPYLVAVIALLRPPAKWAYYLCSALLFAFPVFIVLADIAILLKVGTSSAQTVIPSLVGCGLLLIPFYFRSDEHTSELQSLMRISYAVFC